MNLKSSHFFKLRMHCDHDAEPSSDPNCLKQYIPAFEPLTVSSHFHKIPDNQSVFICASHRADQR
jgi:hypothetical protein